MKRVINRRVYDTETAEQIARYAKNVDTNDFNYFIETLYKTDDARYFLHGRGGSNTKYAVRRNGEHSGSKEIKVFDEEDAIEWCEEQSIDGDIIIEEFGHLIENAGTDEA